MKITEDYGTYSYGHSSGLSPDSLLLTGHGYEPVTPLSGCKDIYYLIYQTKTFYLCPPEIIRV